MRTYLVKRDWNVAIRGIEYREWKAGDTVEVDDLDLEQVGLAEKILQPVDVPSDDAPTSGAGENGGEGSDGSEAPAEKAGERDAKLGAYVVKVPAGLPGVADGAWGDTVPAVGDEIDLPIEQGDLLAQAGVVEPAEKKPAKRKKK